MSKEETTVTTEVTPEAPKGAEAFTAARAAIAAPSDDTSQEQPAEDPEKPADQPPVTGDEPNDALLTPEELAALNPKERAKAEKWQAKLTQKAQALAAKDKEFGEWQPLIDGLKTNPKEAVQKIAEQIGLKIQADKQDTPVNTPEVMAELPEEWQFLKPVFEAHEKRIEARVRAELEPVKQVHETMAAEATAKETEATLATFTAEHKDWKKYEPKMLEIGAKIMPAPGMTDLEYTKILYRLATAESSEAEQTKKVVEKINKSVASSEPNVSGVSSNRVEHALPPPERRTMRDAFEAAKRGERWASK